MALVANAGGQAKADDDRQGAGDDAGVQPETFRQRQAHGRAGSPAWQQVGDRPAGAGHQADCDEARQRHVEHARDHWQHGPQRPDEPPYQQAGNAVALKIGLCTANPLRVVAQ